MESSTVLEVRDLVRHYPLGGTEVVKAVDGVSFAVARGETLALVGESGCGKSTLARMIMALDRPTSGHVVFKGEDLATLGRRRLTRLRKSLQIIFQDPYSSLNPRMSVFETLAEPLKLHAVVARRDIPRRVTQLLDCVGLTSAQAGRYPHEFSGGQRQRIGIARALACEPEMIVCDEPVSALDVSVRAQVLNLLQDLQDQFGFSYLFISHDLSVVRHISHRVAVMYLGRLVEIGSTEAVFSQPSHPYTRALLSAVPIPDPSARRARIALKGDLPGADAGGLPGCRFAPRCPYAQARCTVEVPLLQEASVDSSVACHFWADLPPASRAVAVKRGMPAYMARVLAGMSGAHDQRAP